MTKVDGFPPGHWCWFELATTDAAAAKAFYGALFDWDFHDTPAGPDQLYTFVRLGGDDVGALYDQPAVQREAGAPVRWTLYVSVDDAAAAAARLAELGGRVTAGPLDVGSAGRTVVLADPQGAELALWQAGDHPGSRRVRELGALVWAELLTTDPAAAGEFYSGLFGWGRKASDAAGADYTEWTEDGGSLGGMMAIPAEWGPVPPHWMLYLAVADCDATAARAEELGGGVRVPPTDIPGVGRFAYLVDPQGAAFAVIRMNL
jgi:hypothetical protein